MSPLGGNRSLHGQSWMALMTRLLWGCLLGHDLQYVWAQCAMCDTYLKPQAMKHFTSHNLLLEAAPVSPESSSREHLCSSHNTTTQSANWEVNLYPSTLLFLQLGALPGTPGSTESILIPLWKHPALHFLASREMMGLPPRWASMPVGHPTPTRVPSRLPNPAVVPWTAGSCFCGAGVALLGPATDLLQKGSGTGDNGPSAPHPLFCRL